MSRYVIALYRLESWIFKHSFFFFICLLHSPCWTQDYFLYFIFPLDLSTWIFVVGFYGISTFVGYLTPNPFLCKLSVLLKTIQFSISTQFNCQKHFYFKLFKQLYVIIQLSVNTVLMSKNSSISNNSLKNKHAV